MDRIKQIQDIVFNAWPGLNVINLDGWQMRISDGIHQRANSVLPNNYLGDDVQRSISRVEHVMSNHGLSSIFQIADSTNPSDLDAILEQRGYCIRSTTHVMTLDNPQSLDLDSDFDYVIEEKNEIDNGYDWLINLSQFLALSDAKRDAKIKIINKIDTSLCKKYFLKIMDKDVTLGIALIVKQFDHCGIFEVAVNPEMRNRGVGTQLMRFVLNSVNEVNTVYLQVEKENKSAIRVYEKLGFQTLYNYHYRTLDL